METGSVSDYVKAMKSDKTRNKSVEKTENLKFKRKILIKIKIRINYLMDLIKYKSG